MQLCAILLERQRQEDANSRKGEESGTHPQGRPTPLLAGDRQPKDWTGHRYFFDLVGDFKLWQIGPFVVSQVAGWSSSCMPTLCWRSKAGLPQRPPCCVGGRWRGTNAVHFPLALSRVVRRRGSCLVPLALLRWYPRFRMTEGEGVCLWLDQASHCPSVSWARRVPRNRAGTSAQSPHGVLPGARAVVFRFLVLFSCTCRAHFLHLSHLIRRLSRRAWSGRVEHCEWDTQGKITPIGSSGLVRFAIGSIRHSIVGAVDRCGSVSFGQPAPLHCWQQLWVQRIIVFCLRRSRALSKVSLLRAQTA